MASALFWSRLHRLLYFEPTIDRLSKRKSAWWLQAEIVWCNDVIIWLKLAVRLQKPAWICCVCVPKRAFNAERGHMQGYKIGFRCVLKTHQEPAVPERALPLNVNVSHKLYEMPRGCLLEHTMHLMWEDICSTCNKHRKKPWSAGKLQCLGEYSILELLTSVGTLWFWPSEWNCSHAKLMIPADFTFRGGIET